MKTVVLYSPNTTTFNNNGLGVLSEIISPIVTEERNGIFELTFKYPITGKRYADITYSSVLRCATTPQGDLQTFRIYAISKPMNGIVTYHAEHVSYELSYIAADAFTATSAAEAMVKIKANAMTTCPFDFWTDKNTIANYKQEAPENIRSRLGGVQGSILDVYGGEYEFDNYTVKLHQNRGQNRGVTLRYGKNITDINQEENLSNVYTCIVGYWKNEDTLVKTAVIDSQYANAYPYKRTKVVDFSSEYQDPPTVQQLTAKATSYMSSNDFGIPHVSIKVSFAALWQTEEYKTIAPLERVYLCDTVTIYFEKLGISATAKVVKTIYNVLLDRYDAIELGEARTNLAGRLASNIGTMQEIANDTKSELEKSIERATALITGNKGGYVVTRMDANGKPTELLIMDTDNVDTARKVWRWNLSGWGYSSTGVDGTYRLAATQDGHIVADFVDTGTLTANIIKAGILTDVNNTNYWNLQTGEFKLTGAAKVDDSTIASKANAQSYANSAADSALSTANSNISTAITNYDTALNQLKVFNKLTNDGVTQGIYLHDNKVYINAEYVATGILMDAQGKFALNMTTGALTMHDGSFDGTITGSVIQSAAQGARLVVDQTTSIKGKNGDTLHNLINMEQVVSGSHQMTIDADTQLNIRTPKVYVTNQSYGEGTGTVYETVTSTPGSMSDVAPYYIVQNIDKRIPSQDATVHEVFAGSQNADEGEVYCILPVKISYDKVPLQYIHGMLIGKGSTQSVVI